MGEYARIEVGKPFPGAYPGKEGALIELREDGIMVFIQIPDCTREDRRSFKEGLKRYAFMEHDAAVPLAVFALEFKGLGAFDMIFDAKAAQLLTPDFMNQFVSAEKAFSNIWRLILLDGPIVLEQKIIGTPTKMIELFRQTIQKQLASQYTREELMRAIDSFNKAFPIEEIFRRGTTFKHELKI